MNYILHQENKLLTTKNKKLTELLKQYQPDNEIVDEVVEKDDITEPDNIDSIDKDDNQSEKDIKPPTNDITNIVHVVKRIKTSDVILVKPETCKFCKPPKFTCYKCRLKK
jgi:hypothetical protein